MRSLDLSIADDADLSAIDKSVGKTKLVKTKRQLKKIRDEISFIEASILVINEIHSEAFEQIESKNSENKESLQALDSIVEYCDEMSLILRKIKKII